MRITPRLYAQHIGRMFDRHWHVQKNRRVVETGTEKALRVKNIEPIDASEVLAKPKRFTKMEFETLAPKTHERDETHPDWKDTPCLSYGDHNVLVEGEKQAKALTKTVQIGNELPQRIDDLMIDHDNRVEDLVLRSVQSSVIYDAHQELLPKRKDPARPAWNFPREYGITALRKVRNLSQKMIQLCESLSGPQVAFERNLVHNGVVSLPIEKNGQQLQFILRADLLVTSTFPLKQFAGKNEGDSVDLPDLYPLAPTISLESDNIYNIRDLYPVDKSSQWMNAHTIFAHFDPTEVKNLFETPVTESQIIGRSLMKSFSVAASCARQRFGNDVKILPEPVTVQCVQSDGQLFHFSVFQLNSLDLDGSENKNLWWSGKRIKLYESAGYEEGVPVVRRYNPEVFKRIFAFYKNN